MRGGYQICALIFSISALKDKEDILVRKYIYLFAAVLLCVLGLCSCGDNSADNGPHEAETSAEITPTYAGNYIFVGKTQDGVGEIQYCVELKSDGGYAITEKEENKEQCYEGDSFEWHGSYFVTGAVDRGGVPEASFFESDGSCIWVLGADSGSVYPMRYIEPQRAKDFKNIPYGSESESQVLDIHLPEGEGPFPVIVVVHGGGFKFGDQNMGVIQPIFAATERGFAVVSADYRKSTQAVFPGAVADIKAVVRWIRANSDTYNFNTDRIAIWGESAGAYLAIMTALTPNVSELEGDVQENREFSSAVNVLVSFYAPVDFSRLDEDAAELGMTSSFSASGSFESEFMGRALNEDEDFTRTAWWKTYASSISDDFELSAWIQAGDDDKRVPYLQSVHFADELSGIIGQESVYFSIVPGADHEDAAFYTKENIDAVIDFIDSHM